MAQAGISQADLALVFFTIDHLPRHQKITAALTRALKTTRIVGCSGAGVLTGEGEIERSPGLAVLALASDQIESHLLFSQSLRGRDAEVGAEIAGSIRGKLEGDSILMLFPDGYQSQPSHLFLGIERRLGFVPVVGAGASEDGTLGKSYQLCGENIAHNALSGVLLSGCFDAEIGITQGCQPITEPLTITKAEGNRIAEIDGRPALASLTRLLKGPLSQDLKRALAFVFAGLPADPHKNSVAPGEYVVRNIIGIDQKKGILAVAEEVFEGERIVFTLRDSMRAREDLIQMLQRASQRLDGKTPSLGIYFNCCARGTPFYGIPGMDTAYIRQTLGDFPLIGLFGNFELGPLGRMNRLLAYTGVLVLITEKLNS
jgi:small ligand-binding sensory domain FIST